MGFSGFFRFFLFQSLRSASVTRGWSLSDQFMSSSRNVRYSSMSEGTAFLPRMKRVPVGVPALRTSSDFFRLRSNETALDFSRFFVEITVAQSGALILRPSIELVSLFTLSYFFLSLRSNTSGSSSALALMSETSQSSGLISFS